MRAAVFCPLLINHVLAHAYQVFTAHDATEAGKALRRGRFELLLMDLSTPLCNGIDLLQKIRRHPRLREIPLLVLCASAGLRCHLLDMDVVGVVPQVRWLDDLALTIAETLQLADELPRETITPARVSSSQPARKETARTSQLAAE